MCVTLAKRCKVPKGATEVRKKKGIRMKWIREQRAVGKKVGVALKANTGVSGRRFSCYPKMRELNLTFTLSHKSPGLMSQVAVSLGFWLKQKQILSGEIHP